ncbi:MAG: amidohydrolase family protein [Gammaproteobacteria bacterium]
MSRAHFRPSAKVWFASAALGAVSAAAPNFASSAPRPAAADLVVMDAKIYTADSTHTVAESLAVRRGKFVYVGLAGGARAYVGPHTTVESLAGRLLLPGLFDYPFKVATAVTRRLPGQPPQNPAQAISIRDVIDAYTINGARFLSRDGEAGSIETGERHNERN